MNQSVYGEYNIKVIKSDTQESYYPFGTGYQNNLITDEFLTTILSGWKHGPQSFMQVCRAGTGSAQASKSRTFSNFTHNDETWASYSFIKNTVTGVNANDNQIRLSRDFVFNVLNEERTYREAIVGILRTGNSQSYIQSDLAVSNFVFPNDVVLQAGDRMVINYRLNLVLDYLHPSGSEITLTGDGYDFSGKIKLMSDYLGIFNYTSATNTYINQDINLYRSSEAYGFIYRDYTINSSNFSLDTYDNNAVSPQIFGTRNYNAVGFFGTNNTLSTYPNQFTNPTSPNNILGQTAIITWSNFQINSNGAYIDGYYYLQPHTAERIAAGLYLACSSSVYYGQKCAMYLLFDTPQTIPAGAPISFKLRWYINRI